MLSLPLKFQWREECCYFHALVEAHVYHNSSFVPPPVPLSTRLPFSYLKRNAQRNIVWCNFPSAARKMQFITRFANSWAAFRRGIGQILPSTVPHLLLRQAMFSAVPWFLRLQTNCCCITYTTRRGVARGVGLLTLFTLYVPSYLLERCATWQRINRAWYLRYTIVCQLCKCQDEIM